MALKSYKPTTSSQRGLVLVHKGGLWKGRPLKNLTEGLNKTGGRNNRGRITAWHIGGGHKKLYRIIDFKRTKIDIWGVVERIEYDPNRTSFIALIKYDDNEYNYIIAPQKLQVGDKIIASTTADIKVGNCLPLKNIPVGTTIHNVEMKSGKGGQIARAAGTSVNLAGKDANYAQIKLSSGELRIVPINCKATIGVVSNPDQKNINLGKAGRSVWLGRRPVVRGVVMNPVDHPHGGGEGRTSGGRHPVTPWGKGTKGNKTRKNKRTARFIIKDRRKG